MEFIYQLKQLKLFKPDMAILDIGCRNGWLYDRLKKPGRTYDGLDQIDMIENKDGIRFFKESFTTFLPDKKYDLIFARDVFFFDSYQLTQVERYLTFLKPDGVLCVSIMLEDDPHVGRKDSDGTIFYGVSSTDLESFLENKDILWKQDFKGDALSLGNNLVSWHLCQLIIRK